MLLLNIRLARNCSENPIRLRIFADLHYDRFLGAAKCFSGTLEACLSEVRHYQEDISNIEVVHPEIERCYIAMRDEKIFIAKIESNWPRSVDPGV